MTLESSLRAHVERLAGEIGERHVGRPAALHEAARYIRGAFAAAGFDVSAQAYETRGVRCENLEVTLPGSGKGGIVLLGAHYDTVPGSPGADDNASGVAGLIEISRALRAAPLQRTVKLVAFVNEENPFFRLGEMGSQVYAAAAQRRGEDIRVMFSLEMLGCYTDAPRSQTYPPMLRWIYPSRGNFIAFVSNLGSGVQLAQALAAFRAVSDFPAQGLAGPSFIPGLGRSDHRSFWRVGYAGVMVTDTAFHRYAHYHLPTDTPDRLCYPKMACVVEGLAGTVAELASCR